MNKYLIILLLILAGCAGSNNSRKSENLPAWYVNPKQNDINDLYGVGEGFTIQEASRSALNNLAAKLSVNISSDSSSLMEENNASINEQYRKKVKEQVAAINFNNYQVSNSQRDGTVFYAEVKVDTAKFIEEQKATLGQHHTTMQNLYYSSKNQNILIRRNKLDEVNKMGVRAAVINQILNGLGVNPDFQTNLGKYQFYQDAYAKILDEIEFYIDSDSKKIKDVVAKALSENHLKVANNSIGGADLVLIDIKTDADLKNIYGSNILKLKITIKLLSNKNKILASNIIEVSGASVSNKEDALDNAVKNLAKKIQEETVLKIIGADK